jgi:glucose uptake protein GlcU
MGKGLAIFGVVTVCALILSLTISVYSLTKNENNKNSDSYKAAQGFLAIGILGIVIWAIVSVATTKDDTVGSLASKTVRVLE